MTEDETSPIITAIVKHVFWSLAGAGVFVVCVVVGFVLAAVLGQFRPDIFRGYRPLVSLVAFTVAAGGIWWYRTSMGNVWTMLGALVVVEMLMSALIRDLSGSPTGDPFFMSWFLGLNRYLALPWLGAAAVGVTWSRRKRLTAFLPR